MCNGTLRILRIRLEERPKFTKVIAAVILLNVALETMGVFPNFL